MEVFQTYVVERMDKTSFLQHMAITAIALEHGSSTSEITAILPGNLQGPAAICWRKCPRVFAEMCEQLLQSQTYETSRLLLETPFELAKSKVAQPPIAIDDIDLVGTERDRLVSTSYF